MGWRTDLWVWSIAVGVAGESSVDIRGPLSIAERDSERLHFNNAASFCFAWSKRMAGVNGLCFSDFCSCQFWKWRVVTSLQNSSWGFFSELKRASVQAGKKIKQIPTNYSALKNQEWPVGWGCVLSLPVAQLWKGWEDGARSPVAVVPFATAALLCQEVTGKTTSHEAWRSLECWLSSAQGGDLLLVPFIFKTVY